MKHIYGPILIIWLAVEQIVKVDNSVYGMASLLGALCLFIVKERYFDNVQASSVFLVVISILSAFYSYFILLIGIVLLDFMYFNKYIAAVFVFFGVVLSALYTGQYSYIFHLVSSALFGYVIGIKDKNDRKNILLLDEERHLRYNLEQAQNALIKSRKEVEQLAEIRERNRIAHEIHDNIGHSIAGVIFQMEAARRVIRKDIEKTEGILKLCSEKLSEALELTRNTVYNIRVIKKTGLDRIEEIIKDFKFCKIDFRHNGDFSRVSASGMKILEANTMEALTNAAKYSMADKIEIKIDIGKRNIRFYYKDDGIGCENIKENLGLSGMRERVKNAGGIISIDGSAGFLIVCNIPVRNEGSEEI